MPNVTINTNLINIKFDQSYTTTTTMSSLIDEIRSYLQSHKSQYEIMNDSNFLDENENQMQLIYEGKKIYDQYEKTTYAKTMTDWNVPDGAVIALSIRFPSMKMKTRRLSSSS